MKRGNSNFVSEPLCYKKKRERSKYHAMPSHVISHRSLIIDRFTFRRRYRARANHTSLNEVAEDDWERCNEKMNRYSSIDRVTAKHESYVNRKCRSPTNKSDSASMIEGARTRSFWKMKLGYLKGSFSTCYLVIAKRLIQILELNNTALRLQPSSNCCAIVISQLNKIEFTLFGLKKLLFF